MSPLNHEVHHKPRFHYLCVAREDKHKSPQQILGTQDTKNVFSVKTEVAFLFIPFQAQDTKNLTFVAHSSTSILSHFIVLTVRPFYSHVHTPDGKSSPAMLACARSADRRSQLLQPERAGVPEHGHELAGEVQRHDPVGPADEVAAHEHAGTAGVPRPPVPAPAPSLLASSLSISGPRGSLSSSCTAAFTPRLLSSDVTTSPMLQLLAVNTTTARSDASLATWSIAILCCLFT